MSRYSDYQSAVNPFYRGNGGSYRGGRYDRGALGTMRDIEYGVGSADRIVRGVTRLAGDTVSAPSRVRGQYYGERDYADRREIGGRRTRRVLDDERAYDRYRRGEGPDDRGYDRTSGESTLDPREFDRNRDGRLSRRERQAYEAAQREEAAFQAGYREGYGDRQRDDDTRDTRGTTAPDGEGAPDREAGPTRTPAPEFRGNGQTVALAADTVIDAAMAVNIINATTVNGPDGQPLSNAARLHTVMAEATRRLGLTPPDTSILQALQNPENADNVNALYGSLSTAEKQQYNQDLIAMLTAARDREGVSAEERAALDRDIQRIQAAGDNPDATRTEGQSPFAWLAQLFERIVQAIENAFGGPQRDATAPGPDASAPGPDASAPGPDATTPAPAATAPVPVELSPTMANAVSNLTFIDSRRRTGMDEETARSVGQNEITQRSRAIETIIDNALGLTPDGRRSTNAEEARAYEQVFTAFDRDGDTSKLNNEEIRAFQAALREAAAQGITPEQYIASVVQTGDVAMPTQGTRTTAPETARTT